MKKLSVFSSFLALSFTLLVLCLVLASCPEGSGTTTTYTVRFNANDGSGTVPNPVTVNAGSSITLPNEGGLSKNGYTFGGWNTSDSGTGTNYSAGGSFTPAGDITLFAKWNPITYFVAYDKNAGDASGTMQNSSHNYDVDKILNTNNFIRTDYTFAGWARTAGGTVEFANGASVRNLTTVAGDTVKLYAVWVDSSTVWTVSFETNDGSAVGDAVVLRNTSVSRPTPDPVRTGYTFDNWFSNPELTALYNFSSIIIRDMTLYAKWNPITYTIAYNKNAGDASGTMKDSSHTYDVDKNLNANSFTRTGYTFAGWALTTGGTVEFANGASVRNLTAVAGGVVTLYAQWTTNTITLNVKQIEDGAPIIAAITISRTGSNKTYTVSVSNPSDYSSINWEVAGVGAYAGQTVSGSGASFTLNAEDVKYNSLGGHVLILTVTKGGMQYQRAIPFTIVQ